MTTLQIWFEATRPKTLPAAVAPVVLGTAMAHSDGQLHLLPAAICLVFALLVQIGTNFANDYLDGIKGTDTDARLGPRRAVAAGLVSASTMKWLAIGILAFAFCLGLFPCFLCQSFGTHLTCFCYCRSVDFLDICHNDVEFVVVV